MNRIAAVSLIAFAFAVSAFANPGPVGPAPEIDPGSITTAVALVGSVLLMARRRAKR